MLFGVTFRRGLTEPSVIGRPLWIHFIWGSGTPEALQWNSIVSSSAAFTFSGSSVKYGIAMIWRLMEYDFAAPTPLLISQV